MQSCKRTMLLKNLGMNENLQLCLISWIPISSFLDLQCIVRVVLVCKLLFTLAYVLLQMLLTQQVTNKEQKRYMGIANVFIIGGYIAPIIGSCLLATAILPFIFLLLYFSSYILSQEKKIN